MMAMEGLDMDENEIGTIVVRTAIAVHRELGGGLLESVYEAVLADELRSRGLDARRQVPLAINFHQRRYPNAFRADLLVENKLILELKSVEKINNAHKKQLLTYLKLTGLKLGYLINFNVDSLRHGIHRLVNNL